MDADFYADAADQLRKEKRERSDERDDEMHAGLYDAYALLDDTEVRVVPVEPEPDNTHEQSRWVWDRITGRGPWNDDNHGRKLNG